MGKGDVKSKKGKRWRGSYGVTRPRKKSASAVAAPSAEKPKKAAAKKTTAAKAKKAPAKKAAKSEKSEE